MLYEINRFFNHLIRPGRNHPEPRRSERGLTLAEALMVLIPICVVVAAVVYMFRSAMSSNSANRTLEDIMTIAGKVKELYATQSSYGTQDLTNALRDANLLPGHMVDAGGNQIRNAFGGNVTVRGRNDQFEIQFTGIPKDACTKLATQADATAWAQIQVNGQQFQRQNLPVDPVQAAQACSRDGQGQNGGNQLTWTAY
jgi:Tfp pilus assembly protein PilE